MQCFVSLLHTTHLVHHCEKQWMRAKQCVCICLVHLLLLLLSSLSLLFILIFFLLFNHTIGERFCYLFGGLIIHQPDCVCWVHTVT